MKAAEPKARAKAALRGLRCGQPGHFAANCPVLSKTGTKRPAAATESVAQLIQLEDAHVTFQDAQGHERADVVMLDPGTSAFLCGFGPARRYLTFLASQGYPIEKINFFRCRHKFHFGGDGESWCHWVMEMPMFVSGSYGHAQVFLLKGETPMLRGRPIIEALGVIMDFQQRLVRLNSGMPPLDFTVSISCLFEPEQPIDFTRSLDLDFDLRLAPAGEVDPMGITLADFEKEESAFALMDDSPAVEVQHEPEPRECLLPRHQLRTADELLQAESNQYHAYVTDELHKPTRRRVIWEVYAGRGRVASVAESLGAEVEVFSLDSG